MSRTFREWNPDQSWLFPPSPQDSLPNGQLVYFLMDVSEQLDLSPIMEKYDSEKGANFEQRKGEPNTFAAKQSPNHRSAGSNIAAAFKCRAASIARVVESNR